MRALKVIGIILLVLIGLFLLIPAFLSSNVRIEQNTVIKAPASIIFEQVNTLKNWDFWSPFKDSTMIMHYEGPEAGLGAISKWTSTEQGNGSMEITESVPYSTIATNLILMEENNAKTNWIFEETAEGVKVTWSMDISKLGYPIGRFMGLAFPVWMNPLFSKGLDSLRVHCERLAALPQEVIPEMKIVEVSESNVLMISDSVSMEGLADFFGQSYGTISTLIHQVGTEAAGMPMAIYHSWIMGQKNWVSACIPVTTAVASTNKVKYVILPATKAVMATHIGPYESSGPTWEALQKYITDNGLEINGSPWEVYVNDPATVPASEIQTDIYYPVK